MTPSRPVLRYHGGKWLLASWILGHFPPHRIYVEPFCGAASVLMQKPRTYAEVINDLDGEVINVFRVLRDPAAGAELERLLRLTPFARVEFQESYQPTDNPIERARRTIVRAFMSWGSSGTTSNWSSGFRADSYRSGTTPAKDWSNYPDQLRAFTDRLAGVVVENRPAEKIIAQQDSPETLFYIDPPYPLGTRYVRWFSEKCYRHEMSDDDHRRLAEVLHGVQGMVAISGYDCDLYQDLYGTWNRDQTAAFAGSAGADRERTEVLWMSYDPPGQIGLFEPGNGPPAAAAAGPQTE